MIPMWKTEVKKKKFKKHVKMAHKMPQYSAILPPEKPRNPTF